MQTRNSIKKTKCVVTAEEHMINGGLGDSIQLFDIIMNQLSIMEPTSFKPDIDSLEKKINNFISRSFNLHLGRYE